MKLDSFILNDFFEMLNDIDAEYCVMNNYKNMPEVIPSDVDFAVNLKTFQVLDKLVIKLAEKHDVYITQKIWHGYNKCAFILSPLKIDSYFFLQLDFFVDFSGKGFPNLYPNNHMQNGKKRYKNFYIPSVEVEVPFLLQRRIFKGDIKDSHVKTLAGLYKQNPVGVCENISKIFGHEVGNSLIEFIKTEDIQQFHVNYLTYRKKLKNISNSNTNLEYRFKYIVWQGIRATYRLYFPTGLSVAFIGKDSPLKNALIERFDNVVSGSFHGLVVIKTNSLVGYSKQMLTKVYWAKVTKKKAILDLNRQVIDWKKYFSNKWLKPLFSKPDLVIYLNSNEKDVVPDEYKLTQKSDLEQTLKEVTYLSLKVQANKTEKHLMNKISPTV